MCVYEYSVYLHQSTTDVAKTNPNSSNTFEKKNKKIYCYDTLFNIMQLLDNYVRRDFIYNAQGI